ncbi:MAG: hypothetical protein EOO61_13100 [Hymenobacter sp.]|nr:MAG: hypothetical protein EOO61_13100 [Hymenobacter sp.]
MNRQPLYWILASSLTILAVACSKETTTLPALQVNFTATVKPALDYPIRVQFVNQSDSSNALQWAFGNGQISRQANPLIDYDSSGLFSVQLTATGNGQSGSLSKRIQIPYRRLSVSVFYVVPKERAYDPILMQAIQRAMPLVQLWYNQQLAGRTVQLNQPLVDTLHCDQYGYEYGTTSIGILDKLGEEVYRKAVLKINPDEQIVLLFYPVGIPGAVGVGSAYEQGGSYRRIGVIGSDACQSLSQPTSEGQSLGLWTTAHELGHALGLVHTLTAGALMFGPVDASGYVPNTPRPIFPTCPLTEADRQTLMTSLFLR